MFFIEHDNKEIDDEKSGVGKAKYLYDYGDPIKAIVSSIFRKMLCLK